MGVPVFKAKYRVLVIENRQASQPHQRVLAICLEQNLLGRGNTPREALYDLHKIVIHSVSREWQDRVPAYKPDPDPELATVYESGADQTAGGDPVLRRLEMTLELGVHGGVTNGPRTAPRVTYEEAVA
jgi:hypothetical protein